MNRIFERVGLTRLKNSNLTYSSTQLAIHTIDGAITERIIDEVGPASSLTTISDVPIALKPGTKVKGRTVRRAPGADADGDADVKGAPARSPILFIR